MAFFCEKIVRQNGIWGKLNAAMISTILFAAVSNLGDLESAFDSGAKGEYWAAAEDDGEYDEPKWVKTRFWSKPIFGKSFLGWNVNNDILWVPEIIKIVDNIQQSRNNNVVAVLHVKQVGHRIFLKILLSVLFGFVMALFLASMVS